MLIHVNKTGPWQTRDSDVYTQNNPETIVLQLIVA